MVASSGSPEKARHFLAIASTLLAGRDFFGAKRSVERALSIDHDHPDDLPEQIVAVTDVLLASQNRLLVNNGQIDWYSLLNLPHPKANNEDDDDDCNFPTLLVRHYRRLFVLLNPDRNTCPWAPSAFQLVADAYNVLSDPAKKSLFDAQLFQTSAFWTMCPLCCRVHRYPRAHEGTSLRCPHCRRMFDAVVLPSPPHIVPGTDTYQSSWGFFPLGFPTSLDAEWEPFVPMFPWAQETQPPTGTDPHVTPPMTAVAGPGGWSKKKMARKNVGTGLKKKKKKKKKKKVLSSEILHPTVGVADFSIDKEEVVVAKGIDMNEEANGWDDDDLEMLIDLDATKDVIRNLPFLRDEEIQGVSLVDRVEMQLPIL